MAKQDLLVYPAFNRCHRARIVERQPQCLERHGAKSSKGDPPAVRGPRPVMPPEAASRFRNALAPSCVNLISGKR